MKKNNLLLLVMLMLFAFAGFGRAGQAPSSSATPVLGKGGKQLTQTFKVWGATDELAQQEAIERARRFLEGYGERQQPPRFWSLTAAEVRKLYVKTLEAHPEYDKQVQGETVKCWIATLEVTPAQLEMLDRRARTHERMGLLAKMVVLTVLGAAAISGYLRLEEWTHWRHTWVPRLVSAGLLAAVGAGIWLAL